MNVWGRCEPYCPTDEDPPMIRADLPAYLPLPPSFHGGSSFKVGPDSSWLYSTNAAVGSVQGRLAAAANDRFVGIWTRVQ